MRKILIACAIILSSHIALAVRQVEFEWEEIKGAKGYQVEIRNKQKKILTFNSKTSTFKFKITSGRYEIRGKIYSDSPTALKSEWSEWREFNVPPKNVKPIQISKINPKIKPNSNSAEVPIDWDDTEGAVEYLLEVLNFNNKVIDSIKTTHSATRINLRPGNYRLKVTAFTQDGLSSEPTVSNDTLTIQNISLEPPRILKLDLKNKFIELEWMPETLLWVHLERQAFLGETWITIEDKNITVTRYEFKNLKPGKYRVSFLSKNTVGDNSEYTTKEFIIKPNETDLPK